MKRDWMKQAACADMDTMLFLDPATAREARAVCRRCPVSLECLDYAIEYSIPGMCGGLLEHERRRLPRKTV